MDSEIMNIIFAVGIYCIVYMKQGDARSSNKSYYCLVNLRKLEKYLDGRSCQSKKAILYEISRVRTMCQKPCKYTWSFQNNTLNFKDWQDNCKNASLKIELFLNNLRVIRKKYPKRDCKHWSSCNARFTCKISIQPKEIMEIISWFLDEKGLSTTCKEHICDHSTYTPKMTPKPCAPWRGSTTKDKQCITTLTGDAYHPQVRSRNHESDCTGIAVGIGFLGAVVGVIITSTLCICWILFKRPKRDFKGQAMTNKTYGISGDEKVDDVGSKPRQRSVIYSEINDDPTHGYQKVSLVAPIIRDTEEKPNRAINDRDVYNHLNEQVNEDETDDYDHARPVPVQNNDTDNAYGKLNKMTAITKSMPDDKRLSSPSVNHDYGEHEIVETGVKRPDNGTQNSGTDDNVGNDDNDNYFTLEKSQT